MTHGATLPLDHQRLAAALAGRYRVERELGAGGNATVYLAEDLRHSRPVAIKVLTPDLARLLGTERFLREITVAARLRHPHLVPLFDSGEAADPADPANRYLYYVMPLVEGASLRDHLERDHRLPLDEALAITRDIAAALTYAHEHDVVHRDIKPENILLDSGRAVLADFGIARAVSAAGAGRLTQQGMAIGTPAYMSPEQIAGENIDFRSDVYSLACVLYEMLDGEPPFAGANPQAVMARRLSEPVRPLAGTRGISPALNAALLKGLATNPRQRYPTAAAFVGALQQAVASEAARLAASRGARRRVGMLAGAAVVVAVAALTAWRAVRAQQRNHLVDRQIPGITRAIERGDIATAYRLAERAEQLAPNHQLLRELWPRMAAWVSVESEPAGAHVDYQPYADSTAKWITAGTTPIRALRLAIGVYRVRFLKDGYDTLEVLSATPEVAREVFTPIRGDSLAIRPDSVLKVQLVAAGLAPGMVRVPVSQLAAVRGYVSDDSLLPGSPYWVDRTEVTNQAWQQFVDGGGYQDSTWWDRTMIINGARMGWASALQQFRDRTGRPGPSTWEGGTYPAGTATWPVRGISWYEAVAYSRFVHKELPSVWHWFTASGWRHFGAMAPLSNIDHPGPAPVAQYRGVNEFGAFDMIGNVREWLANATDSTLAQRYLSGGSWLNPSYYFWVDAQDASDRSPENGVRLVRGTSGASPVAFAPTSLWRQGHRFGDEIYQTATDAEFRLYRDNLYGYGNLPLHDSVLAVDDASHLWRRETVSFTTAYGGERMRAYLFIPKGPGLAPPYQAVVYVPTGMAWDRRDSRYLGQAQGQHDNFWEAIALSGRAVLYPIVQGTYERHVTLEHGDANGQQTMTIEDVQDVRRSVDYLMTRHDIDTAHVGYYGVSAGAAIGPIVAALEPRLRAFVLLLSPCFNNPGLPGLPPVTPMRFLPRVHQPLLSIAGGDDFVFSDGRQCLERQFTLLGTPAWDRRNVLYPGNHGMWGAFAYQARQEILAWFDRYLGPVLSGPR